LSWLVLALGWGALALPLQTRALPAPGEAPSANGPIPPGTPHHGPARQAIPTGLVSIESDIQRADQATGVITATGNVRILYPDKGVMATARQAQYFTREGRVVLSGDVDVVQQDGNLLRAEQVTYLVGSERITALPAANQQVLSRLRLTPNTKPAPAPTTPGAPAAAASNRPASPVVAP
jgi:lipopolysaccharide export system protein LptA